MVPPTENAPVGKLCRSRLTNQRGHQWASNSYHLVNLARMQSPHYHRTVATALSLAQAIILLQNESTKR